VDPDDDKFMRCARAAGAVVVSGDRDLLEASGWSAVEVLTPRGFPERLRGAASTPEATLTLSISVGA